MKHNDGLSGFFILVFALSIPFWLLHHFWPVQMLPGLPVSAFAVFAPTLAAVIMAYRTGRLEGLRNLLGRSFDIGRIRNKTWYFLFILFNPAVAVIVYGVMRTAGRSVPLPAPLTPAVFSMFIFFLIGALAEEIGWTGWATEPMRRRWGTLRTGILLGLIWTVFHLVMLTQVNRSPMWIAWWSLGTLSLRTFMVWLFDHAGKSVFAAALFHAMINMSWQLFPVEGSYYDPRLFSTVTLCLAVMIVAFHRFATGRHSPASAQPQQTD